MKNISLFIPIIHGSLIATLLILQQSLDTPSVEPSIYQFNSFSFIYLILTGLILGNSSFTYIREAKIIFLGIIILFLPYLIITLNSNTVFNTKSLWIVWGLINITISAILLNSYVKKESLFNILVNLWFISAIFGVLKKVNSIEDIAQYFIFENILFGKNLTLESDLYSFIFGLFALYYLSKSKYFPLFIAIILVFLTGKRIVFLAIIISIISTWLPFNRKHFYKTALIINLFLIYVTFLIASNNEYLNLITEKFLGINLAVLTSGRTYIYEPIIYFFGEPKLFGNGLGVIDFALKREFNQIMLLHSDLLKLAYEIGILGTFVLLFYLYKLSINSNLSFSVIILLNIFFITDNVLEYQPVMLLFLLLFLRGIYEEKYKNINYNSVL